MILIFLNDTIRYRGEINMAYLDQAIGTMTTALDYGAKRNELISNNISNVDTPNYKAKDTSFKSALSQAESQLEAKRTRPKHLSFSSEEQFPIHAKKGTSYSHNGNNVDIDKEMSDLAKNEIYYRSMTDQLNNKFNMIKTAIKGG